MKHFVTLIAFFCTCTLQGFSQVVPNISMDSVFSGLLPIYFDAIKNGLYESPRDTALKNLKTYESSTISFQVPESWLNLGGMGDVVEVVFDGSDLYFTDSFNNRPVLTGLFLLNQPGDSLEQVKSLALIDYRSNNDRIFEPDYVDSVFKFTLQSGEKCYVLHTRFLRKSSQLNQSRYDLILFSEKFQKGYSVMLSVQYSDPSYAFENNNALGLLAARLFSKVLLK